MKLSKVHTSLGISTRIVASGAWSFICIDINLCLNTPHLQYYADDLDYNCNKYKQIIKRQGWYVMAFRLWPLSIINEFDNLTKSFFCSETRILNAKEWILNFLQFKPQNTFFSKRFCFKSRQRFNEISKSDMADYLDLPCDTADFLAT